MFKKLLTTSIFFALTFSFVGVNAMEKNINNENLKYEEKQKLEKLKKLEKLDSSLADLIKKLSNANLEYEKKQKLEKSEKPLTNSIEDFNNEDLNHKEKRKLKKLQKSEKPLTNLIEDFNKKLVEIKKTSNNYAGFYLIKTIEEHIQTLKDKEYYPPWEITNENNDKLHSKKIFNMYETTSDLLNNVEKMENLIINLETAYEEYLKFINKIKNKKVLDSYNNNEENIKKFNEDIDNLQKEISSIFFSIDLPTPEIMQVISEKKEEQKTYENKIKEATFKNKKHYWDFYEKLNNKKISENIEKKEIFKKQIEIRKEILPFIKKIVQSDIIENMEAKILDAVDEEIKIRNQFGM